MFFGDEFKRKSGSMPAKERPEILPSSMMEPDPKHFAAQDIMDAHKMGNTHHLKQALSNFIDLHNFEVHKNNLPQDEEPS